MARGLIGYDLPSENEPGISGKKKTFRNSMRRSVWYYCKENLDSEQLQDSLWLVKECKPHDILKILNEWNEKYNKMKDQPTFFFVNLPENINIIWIGKKKIRAARKKKR